jgi:DNA-binding MarR family transcriptional regulator
MRHPGLLAWMHMVRVNDKMHSRLSDFLEEYNLTHAQFDVLAQLKQHPGSSQQELSEFLLVTKGNVCGLIDRMSARGLVERRSDPNDRRVNLLHLTERGQELADRVVPALEDHVRLQFSVLSLSEMRELNASLRNLDRLLV